MVRYAGIDIGSEKHFVAVVDADGKVQQKPLGFKESAEGYAVAMDALGSNKDVLICMEATGHYWENLHFYLDAEGYSVAVVNPLRAARFMEVDLRRAKNDSIDALGLANFAAQKRPKPIKPHSAEAIELRELVNLRNWVLQQQGDTTRRLHGHIDRTFPEFKGIFADVISAQSIAIWTAYPSLVQLARVRPSKLAELVYDSRHSIGMELAEKVVAAAKTSVGSHHSNASVKAITMICEDLKRLAERLVEIEADLEKLLEVNESAKWVAAIDGMGTVTTAKIFAVAGNPADFESAKKFAAFCAAVPEQRHSGKSTPNSAPLTNLGAVALRTALWMPTLSAIRCNPWIAAFYERLVNRGKPRKKAVIACMRKLLTAIYWAAKHKKYFDPHLTAKAQQGGSAGPS